MYLSVEITAGGWSQNFCPIIQRRDRPRDEMALAHTAFGLSVFVYASVYAKPSHAAHLVFASAGRGCLWYGH